MKQKPVVEFKTSPLLFVFYHFFDILRQISLYQQIKNIGKKIVTKKYLKKNFQSGTQDIDKEWKNSFWGSPIFSDVWVLTNLLLGVISCIIVSNYNSECLCWVACVYAMLRTFEIFVYQVNVLLFDPIKVGKEKYAIESATRMILLLLCNIIEYILWFSVIYLFVFRTSGDVVAPRRVILDSFMTLSTTARPEEFSNSLVKTIAYVEFVLGIFMNILCLARFISLLPSVRTKRE